MTDKKEKYSVLVVDDDPEYRNAAVASVVPYLPADWRVVAPATLDGALVALELQDAPEQWKQDPVSKNLRDIEREVGGSVRIVLLDNSLAGHGYQVTDLKAESDNSYRGWQLADRLKYKNEGVKTGAVKTVAFSRNGHSAIKSNAQASFAHKQDLHKPGDEGKNARMELADIVTRLINEVEKEDAEVCGILESFQGALAKAVEAAEPPQRVQSKVEEELRAS